MSLPNFSSNQLSKYESYSYCKQNWIMHGTTNMKQITQETVEIPFPHTLLDIQQLNISKAHL